MSKVFPLSLQDVRNIEEKYPTPFHIYDEKRILENAKRLKDAFSWADFKEYYAVKACPNPHILKSLKTLGFGTDCSSIAELIMSERVGIVGEDIMFTSNDTPVEDFVKADKLGAIINFDDITHIDFYEKNIGKLPELVCFRFNPGKLKGGNTIIGHPEEAKYGFTKEQLFEGYKILKDKGVKRFGLHTMVASNELNPDYFIETARILFDLVVEISNKLEISFEFINMGGGIGIPYKLEDKAVDLEYVGNGVKEAFEEIIVANGKDPLKIYMENGRMITGPYGYLVTKAIHKKNTYKNYIGLNSCMADLMRPALYGAYHHITVLGKEAEALTNMYDVTGSLCENNDKFAINRDLPEVEIGDYLVIHDAGAHGSAMGFNYNGKLRCAELYLKEDGSIELIRRAQTLEDYFATLTF